MTNATDSVRRLTGDRGLEAAADRRGFLKKVALVAGTIALTGPSVDASSSGGDGRPAPPFAAEPETAASMRGEITPRTISEGLKLSGLRLTAEQQKPLVAAVEAQLRDLEAVRKLSIPRETTLALKFDPRLPGHSYPAQPNRVRLARSDAPSLPRDDVDIAYAPVIWLSHWIQTRQLTCARLTDIYLSRIGRIAPQLFCYITVTAELARAEAKTLDRELARGHYRGPLHGIPYALKDVFDTAGIPTTYGSAIFKDRVPDADAAIVTMLRKAGAVLLGKAATAELGNGDAWFGGQCRNPWNTEESAGGSSAGSGPAAAAGLCGFAIGTDSLGSILNPADRCGVVGLRASFGRVPVKGAMPLTSSLKRTGPLCRRVEDAALVMAAINGPDSTSISSIDMGFTYDGNIDIRRLKVGYSPGWFKQVVGYRPGSEAPTSDAHQHALEALRSLGVDLIEVEMPALPYSAIVRNLYIEAAATYQDLTLNHGDERMLKDNAWRTAWRQAHMLSAVDYLQLDRLRRKIMEEMHNLYTRIDAAFMPTYGSFDFLTTMNFTGHPGLTLRAGFVESPTRDEAPKDPNGPKHTVTQNVAFHGRLFEEGKILALGRALEAKLDVWKRRPPIG
jgi:Asp-tRNA(Asn)/Glu-tRNA(Gln) amidotransferase A subunit family amidase